MIKLNDLPVEIQEMMIRYPEILTPPKGFDLLTLKNPKDMIRNAKLYLEAAVASKDNISVRARQTKKGRVKKRGLKDILSFNPKAKTVDGITVEEQEFRNKMDQLARIAWAITGDMAECRARTDAYMRSWVQENPDKSRSLLSALEVFSLRAEQLKNKLSRIINN